MAKNKYIEWIDNWVPAKIANLDSPCWDCALTPYENGYTSISRDGKGISTHRYIYQVLFGFLPHNIFVRHRCDNRRCINPEHLIPGTQKENIQDAVQRGRIARGESSGKSKLTEQDIIDIRSSKLRRKELAFKYGIHYKYICMIILGKAWRHIDGAHPAEGGKSSW